MVFQMMVILEKSSRRSTMKESLSEGLHIETSFGMNTEGCFSLQSCQ